MSDYETFLQLFYYMLKRMKKEWSNNLKGINHTQYLILKYLNQLGPQKAVQLAELTQMTPGAITGATDRIVAEGYAERKGDKEDRRVVYLEITEQGKTLVESLAKEQNEVTMKFFQGLPGEDMQHLVRIYHKIMDNLEQ